MKWTSHLLNFLFLLFFSSCTKTINIEGITLDSSSISLEEGSSIYLHASIFPENASNTRVVWSSSNENVVTVKDGLVRAKRVGLAQICVSTEDKTKQAICVVNVCEKHYPVSSILLSASTLEISVGESVEIIPTLLPDLAQNKNVEWTSDNSDIVTVSDGKVTGIKTGETLIHCKAVDGECESTCQIFVAPRKLTSLSFSFESIACAIDTSFCVSIVSTPEDAISDLFFTNSNQKASTYEILDSLTIMVTTKDYGTNVITVHDRRSGLEGSLIVSSYVEDFEWLEYTTERHAGYPMITLYSDESYDLRFKDKQKGTSRVLSDFSIFNFYNSNNSLVDCPNILSISDEGFLSFSNVGIVGIEPKSRNNSKHNRLFIKIVTDPHRAVDLGLPSGVRWANNNFGAEYYAQSGSYLFWGDPSENATISSHHIPSLMDVCGTDYDIVHRTWGGRWRMPNKEEQEELFLYGKWQQPSINGVYYHSVTGPSGQSIWFNSTGYIKCYTNGQVETKNADHGYFMTGSSLFDEGVRYYYVIHFDDNSVYYNGYLNAHTIRVPIRPVRDVPHYHDQKQ